MKYPARFAVQSSRSAKEIYPYDPYRKVRKLVQENTFSSKVLQHRSG
jgi:hypothetical protein